MKSCPLVPSCGTRAATLSPTKEAKLFPSRCNPTWRYPGLWHRDFPSEANAEAAADVEGMIPYLRSPEQTRTVRWGEAPAQPSPGTL